MIELSLETLNKKSPYKITLAEDGGYDFITSIGIHYTIYFDDDQPMGGCKTYQFIIQKVEHQHSPHDPKVEQTILNIVDQFFQNTLMYCFTFVMTVMDVKLNATGCSLAGLINLQSLVVLLYVLLILSLKGTDSTLPS